MDSTSEKTGAPERRVSTRNSVRISVHDADEDVDMMAMGMVADGFRPAQFSQPAPPLPPPPSTPSLASSSATILGEESPESARKARPSSVSKPHRPQDSLTLRREGGMEQIPEPEGLTRQLSASTDSTAYLPSESSYQGPLGPSHPYQMYPQDVRMARTMSTTTASTVPISESSYAGPRGPSHPYEMYPQTDGTETRTNQDQSIPLGFHGLPDQYQRRLGPDGEESADLIGPDGHTEQLPPYTRYPDESYVRKIEAVEGNPTAATQQETILAPAPAIAVAPAVPPVVTQRTSSTPEISGAGGIGLATRNPEFDSTDDLGSPQSRHSSRSFTSDSTQSQNAYKPFMDGVTEKEKPLKPWQLWMRRKLWGIVPYWVICMIGLLLLLMGVILGSVIGAFLSKQKKPRRPWSPHASLVPTATFGAIPVPTPPDLQPLPTGTFSMALMPSRESKTCFQDTTLSQAWNCFFVMYPHLTIAQENAGYTASLTTNESLTISNNVYSYGEQPPRFEKPFTLELVNDTFETTRGPAWYKLLQYNKTVVIPEILLNSSLTPSVPGRRIRSIAGISDFKRKGLLRRGDKPWVCTWPDVYLELFIYPQQNTSLSGFPPGGVGGGAGSGNGMGGVKPSQGYGPIPTQSVSESPSKTEGVNPATPTAPPPERSSSSTDVAQASLPSNLPGNSQQNSQRNPPQNFGQNSGQNRPGEFFSEGGIGAGSNDSPSRSKDRGPEARSIGEDNHTSTSTESSSPTGTPTFGTIDTGDNYGPPPPFFPRVIKLGERRVWLPGGREAECRQIEIQGHGIEAKPVTDSKGNPVVIKIVENEPSRGPGAGPGPGPGPGQNSDSSSSSSSSSKRSSFAWEKESRLLTRDTYPDMSPCGCMWWRI
ncbi:hypothetical protein QBC43DRAFT_18395 [Cladorrhinum sp. PSN259]|nr:hypothetical protein QBC43DRAFT_18395 [Cladorrhinum sp. PSN259]